MHNFGLLSACTTLETMNADPFGQKPEKTESEVRFDQLASTVRRKAVAEIKKHQKLIDNLHSDLEKHGDAERWKRFGDLFLFLAGNGYRLSRRDDERGKIFLISFLDRGVDPLQLFVR